MYRQESIKPYRDAKEKKEQVEAMFDHIASTYDFFNHALSWGIDRRWRRKAIDSLLPFHPRKILDIATGTGDFAILSARRLQPDVLIGSDISRGMMEVGKKKVESAGLQDIIHFEQQDCLHLTFPDQSFDAVTVAYGVRNFQDLDEGLRQMYRVLTSGGHLLILELATPPHFPMRQLFWLYAHIVMPMAGRLICGDKEAYTYLPATMEAFPQAEVMREIILKAGFSSVQWHRFTFGICTMYLATR